MNNVEIGYPVCVFDGVTIPIPDRYTISHIIGSIMHLNGDVTFDKYEFTAQRYRCTDSDEMKVYISIYEKLPKDRHIQIVSSDETLESLEEFIYKIMSNIDKFPQRDVRYNVTVQELDR